MFSATLFKAAARSAAENFGGIQSGGICSRAVGKAIYNIFGRTIAATWKGWFNHLTNLPRPREENFWGEENFGGSYSKVQRSN